MDIEKDPLKVEKLGEQLWDENWRFRSFLKFTDHEDEELDGIVRRHLADVTAQIDCTECGHCCRVTDTVLDRADIKRLAEGLKISEQAVITRYLRSAEEKGKFTFKSLPCPLLKGNKCSVYEWRPEECRSYPNIHKDEFRSRLMGVVNNCRICPIVFNVYERLKSELWTNRDSPDPVDGDEYDEDEDYGSEAEFDDEEYDEELEDGEGLDGDDESEPVSTGIPGKSVARVLEVGGRHNAGDDEEDFEEEDFEDDEENLLLVEEEEDEADLEADVVADEVLKWVDEFAESPRWACLTEIQRDHAFGVIRDFAYYACSYRGDRPKNWTRNTVRECCLELLPRKVTSEGTYFESMASILDPFFLFLAETGRLPKGGGLARTVRSIDRAIVHAGRDRSHWGMAKTLAMDAYAAGVDPTNQEEMGRFVKGWNARLLGQLEGRSLSESASRLRPALEEPSFEPPSDRYAPCPCGSGKKYKFCCERKR